MKIDDEFTLRLANVYKKVNGEESAHGSKAWFARLNDVQAYTVSRWCQGLAPSAVHAHLLTLERLGDMQVELTRLHAAKAQHKESQRDLKNRLKLSQAALKELRLGSNGVATATTEDTAEEFTPSEPRPPVTVEDSGANGHLANEETIASDGYAGAVS
tara:strand:+ start:3706 stop:4179 length:474 start_codon:yes stop_codon:yes gene_type:complete